MVTTAVADEMLRYLYVASLRPLATLGVLAVGVAALVGFAAVAWWEHRQLGRLRRALAPRVTVLVGLVALAGPLGGGRDAAAAVLCAHDRSGAVAMRDACRSGEGAVTSLAVLVGAGERLCGRPKSGRLAVRGARCETGELPIDAALLLGSAAPSHLCVRAGGRRVRWRIGRCRPGEQRLDVEDVLRLEDTDSAATTCWGMRREIDVALERLETTLAQHDATIAALADADEIGEYEAAWFAIERVALAAELERLRTLVVGLGVPGGSAAVGTALDVLEAPVADPSVAASRILDALDAITARLP